MISVTVARNADEAQRLARGEDITVTREEGEEAAAAAAAEEVFFEPEAIAGRRSREEEDERPQTESVEEKK
jgi:large subunit ribosomal protein L9